MTDHQKQLVKIRANLPRRYRAQKMLKASSAASVMVGIAFIFIFFGVLIDKGKGAFLQTYIQLDITLESDQFVGDNLQKSIHNAHYNAMIRRSLYSLFPEVSSRKDKKVLRSFISNGAPYHLRDKVKSDPDMIGKTVSLLILADDEVDLYAKGHIDLSLQEDDRRVKDQQVVWLKRLEQDGRLVKKFNTVFFTNGDSREPEQAGILVALVGSFYAILIALLLAFPIGIATVIYLEEFAPRNRFTDLIEININNLAAVPSILFGLLGLAVLLNFAGLPRSTPLVGGIVLALMTLPTIIIAGRASLKTVPNSIREAAISLGASKTQAVFHHVLPLGMPGILTSTVIGMAQALGETAPLLMIGMVAFMVDVPQGITDPATALPVQIYLWADSPERAFVEKTSGAILVLLTFLIIMNLTAVVLRNRLERKW